MPARPGQQAGDGVDLDQVRADIDARDARRLDVGADRVGELAVAGVAQRDVEDQRDAQEDDHRPDAGADRRRRARSACSTGWPRVYHLATPRAVTIMPSVAMNGGMPVVGDQRAVDQPGGRTDDQAGGRPGSSTGRPVSDG